MKKIVEKVDLIAKKIAFGPLWSIFIAIIIILLVVGYTFIRENVPSLDKILDPPKAQTSFLIVGVVDGDTVKIDYNGTVETVRLLGINTPEHNECLFTEASNKLEELVYEKYVEIESDPTQAERDKYGRLLLYLWHDDLFVNEEMVRGGYAYEYTYDYPYKYQELFIKAQKDARLSERGLWGNVCDR